MMHSSNWAIDFPDMVVFLNSEIEPTLMNGTRLIPMNSNQNNDNSLANDANVRRVRDQAFTIPRVTMSNNNYAQKFDNIDKINDKKLSVDINPEPVFVKKVAGKKNKINSSTRLSVCAHQSLRMITLVQLNANSESLVQKKPLKNLHSKSFDLDTVNYYVLYKFLYKFLRQ